MARGRGTAGGRKLGMTPKVDSDQNRKLFIHVPFADRPVSGTTGNGGNFPVFKERRNGFVVKTNDPSNYGRMTRHPTRGIYVPQSYQWAGGSGQVSFSMVRPYNSPGYNSNNKDYPTPKRFTANIWFRQTAAFVAQYSMIMGEIAPGYDSAGYNWWANWMVRLENNYKPRFYICDGTSPNYGEYHAPIGSYSLNQDYMLTYTYDGATVRGYLNAVQVATGSFSFGMGQSVGNIEIASCRQSLFNEFGFNGLFWDFRIYSEALSPSQIWRLYNYTNDLYQDSKRLSVSGLGLTIEKTLSQSLALSDTTRANKDIRLSVSQNLATSQSVLANRNYFVTISSSLAYTQRVNTQWTKTVTQSVGFTQTIAFARSRFVTASVSHEYAYGQIIARPKLSRVARVTQSLAMSDSVDNKSTFVTHTLTLSQSISFIKEVNSRVTQSLGILDTIFVNSPRIMSLYHNFLYFDSIAARNSVTRLSLVHSFSVTQAVTGRNATFRLNVTQSFATSQTLIRRDAVYRVNVADTLGITQRVNTHWQKRVDQDITVTQTVVGVRELTRNLVTTVTVSSSFDKTREVIRTLESRVEVLSTFDRSIEVTRTFTEQVGVKSNFTPVLIAAPGQLHLPGISGGPPEFGAASGTRIPIEGVETATGNIVKLEVQGSLILLPAPQLANTLNLNQSVITLETETGAKQAYPITTGQEGFEYTFFLDRPKAFELRKWVENHHSERMVVTNWRGERWQGYLITEEIDFTFEGVRAGSGAEKVVVPLKFRGVRV